MKRSNMILASASLLLAVVSPLSHAREGAAGSGVPPLEPIRVVRGFEPPSQAWLAGHRGVDLAGHPGAQVRAPLAGRVRFSGRVGGKPVVTIDHGTFRTTYEPVLAALPVGSTVSAGEVIGTLQVLQSHCFPAACLHWGLIVGGEYRDPLSLLGLTPVRLLPLGGRKGGLVSAAPALPPPHLARPGLALRTGVVAAAGPVTRSG